MRDADALLHMTDTAGWRLLEQHIQERIDDRKGQLMTCKNWEEVLQHRSAAEALESVFLFIQSTVTGEEEDNAEV